MFTFLVVLLIIDALVLSAVVLLQAGQGGGLASLGGAGGTGDSLVGGRQAVTILTKATWWCGGIFMALSLILSIIHRGSGGSGIQERLRTTAPTAPAPLPVQTTPATGATGTPAPTTSTPAAPSAPAPKP